MLRLSPPGFERFLQSPMFVATFGGGEANVAVSLAHLGTASRFLTVLPAANPLSDGVIGELRRFGVETSQIVRAPGRLGVYFVETGANQRPSKVVYDRAGSSIAVASPGTIDWEQALAGATWFHVTGITPAISASATELSLEALRYAKEHGISTSCDLNFRKNLWNWGKQAHEVMPDLLRLTDHCIANEEDCQKSINIHVDIDVESGSLEHDMYRELAARVMANYENLKSLAITLRESKSASHNGWSACLTMGGKFYASRRYEITHIVDRVGAGDSFGAGLIHSLSRGDEPQQALEFAVAASCLKHSLPGDFSRFSEEDVRNLLTGGGSGRVQR